MQNSQEKSCKNALFHSFFFENLKSQSTRIYLFKINNEDAGTMSEICSKLTTKTLGRGKLNCCRTFIVNFEDITHYFAVYVIDFEQVNANWGAGNSSN